MSSVPLSSRRPPDRYFWVLGSALTSLKSSDWPLLREFGVMKFWFEVKEDRPFANISVSWFTVEVLPYFVSSAVVTDLPKGKIPLSYFILAPEADRSSLFRFFKG
jgi:hypothetical protein